MRTLTNFKVELDSQGEWIPIDATPDSAGQSAIPFATVVIYPDPNPPRKPIIVLHDLDAGTAKSYRAQNPNHFFMVHDGNNWIAASGNNANNELDEEAPSGQLDTPVLMDIREGSQYVCFGNRCYRF